MVATGDIGGFVSIPQYLFVIVQEWEESNGLIKNDDGFSLHPYDDCRKEFVNLYWSKMPDKVPGTYSRTYKEPYLIMTDEGLHTLVQNSDLGLRVQESEVENFMNSHKTFGFKEYVPKMKWIINKFKESELDHIGPYIQCMPNG